MNGGMSAIGTKRTSACAPDIEDFSPNTKKLLRLQTIYYLQ